MIKILSVTGPTASGKTALAISLAKALDGEIISCDSMQIYRGLEIGTAAPLPEEMDGIPHYGIGICDPTDSFSAADWVEMAVDRISDIVARGKIPIICGGTGLYLDSLCMLDSFGESHQDPHLREELTRIASRQGNETLHAMLREIDPVSASAIHPNNVKRVIRAIEIYHTTGQTKTEIDVLQRIPEKRYDERRIILEFADRQFLYDRINRRVDMMLEKGLLEEARMLWEWQQSHPDLVTGTAWQAIGFKEFFPYFSGDNSLSDCVDQLKQSSRRYAKRQITWFRRSDGYRLTPDKENGTLRDMDEMVHEVMTFCTKPAPPSLSM